MQRLATWPVAILAALAAVLCQVGFRWRLDRLGGINLLDTRQWYTPEQAAALFEALDRLDPNARTVYALTELSLDLVFPIAYGLLFSILLFRFFEDRGLRLYLLPSGAATVDVLENISIALLSANYDGAPSSFAWMAATLTLLKSGLILATLLALFGGLIHWLTRTARRGPRPGS